MAKQKSSFKKVRVNDLISGKLLWLDSQDAVNDYNEAKEEKEKIQQAKDITNEYTESLKSENKFPFFRGSILLIETTQEVPFWEILKDVQTYIDDLLDLVEDPFKPTEYVLNNRGNITNFGMNENAFFNALESLKLFLNKENNLTKKTTKNKSVYALMSIEIKEYTRTIRITAFVI